MYIDLPGDSRLLQFLEYHWRGEQSTVRPELVSMPLRGAGYQIHSIGRSAGHHRRKPAIRCRKVGSHEVVIVQITAVVVTHRPLAGDVVERWLDSPRVVASRENEAVESRTA